MARSTYRSPWRAKHLQGRSTACGSVGVSLLLSYAAEGSKSCTLQAERAEVRRAHFTRAIASVKCALGAQPPPYFERISGLTSQSIVLQVKMDVKAVSRIGVSYLRGGRDSSQSLRCLSAPNTRSRWVRIKSCSRLCASGNLEK